MVRLIISQGHVYRGNGVSGSFCCVRAKATVDTSLGYYNSFPTLLLYSPYQFLAGTVMLAPLHPNVNRILFPHTRHVLDGLLLLPRNSNQSVIPSLLYSTMPGLLQVSG